MLRDYPRIDVVITSGLRMRWGLDAFKTLFAPDLASRVVGVTPVYQGERREHPERYGEILRYLAETGNEATDWVALDDTPMLFPSNCAQLVLCSPLAGFNADAERRLRSLLPPLPPALVPRPAQVH